MSKDDVASLTALFAVILGVAYWLINQLLGGTPLTGLFQNLGGFIVAAIAIAVLRLANDAIVEVTIDGLGYLMRLVVNIGLTITLTVVLVYFGVVLVPFALAVSYLVETSIYGWLKDYLREEETESAARASTTRPKAA